MKSNEMLIYSSTKFEVFLLISIPTSARVSIAFGFTPWASIPALNTSTSLEV